MCGVCGNLLSPFFDKNFVKATILRKKLLKSWFHETFVSAEIAEILCHNFFEKIRESNGFTK